MISDWSAGSVSEEMVFAFVSFAWVDTIGVIQCLSVSSAVFGTVLLMVQEQGCLLDWIIIYFLMHQGRNGGWDHYWRRDQIMHAYGAIRKTYRR